MTHLPFQDAPRVHHSEFIELERLDRLNHCRILTWRERIKIAAGVTALAVALILVVQAARVTLLINTLADLVGWPG